MAAKKKTQPRKRPQQARAQTTVHAILEATVQVLEREGYDAATTTRIAEVAGVSVGTLYQYYSHRDAIFDALQEREFERALVLMQTVLSDDNLAKSPRETVSGCVQGMLALYVASPGMHRVLAMEGLRATKADRIHSFDLRIIALVRHFLAATGAPVRRKNVDAAAFVAFQCVRATMLASLLESPAGLNDEALVEELVDLLLRYLVDDAWLAQQGDLPANGARRPAANGTAPAIAAQAHQTNA
ncbi:MAG: TetR/AcrR family transcriptional regulator [Labilithrix sp.]|nr:TetR/AcrR family transcriptional regulator [Labilithrix sp.]